MPFHLLHPVKNLTVNDWLMGVLHQVHLQLPTVLFFLPGQEIWSVGLLYQHLPRILLVAQHPVDSGGTPLALARDRLDSVRFQMLLDFPYTVSLYIEVKDHSNDFGLLGNDLQHPIRALDVAEEASMVEQRLTAPRPVTDAKLDILATGLTLRLIQSGQLVNDTVTGSQCIDASGFDINTDIHTL